MLFEFAKYLKRDEELTKGRNGEFVSVSPILPFTLFFL